MWTQEAFGGNADSLFYWYYVLVVYVVVLVVVAYAVEVAIEVCSSLIVLAVTLQSCQLSTCLAINHLKG